MHFPRFQLSNLKTDLYFMLYNMMHLKTINGPLFKIKHSMNGY